MNIFPSGTFCTSPDQGFTFSSRMERSRGEPLRVAERVGLTSSNNKARTEAMLKGNSGLAGGENGKAESAPEGRGCKGLYNQALLAARGKHNLGKHNLGEQPVFIPALRLHDVERGAGGKLYQGRNTRYVKQGSHWRGCSRENK